ncbi:iron chelate uptake ABC transporter family permease subunit, partial [Escherichia coli]
ARMMGFRRTMPHIVISALVGGLLLVFADWCGRMVLFPFQIPAGAAYSPTYARFSNGYGFPKSSTSERPVTLKPTFL